MNSRDTELARLASTAHHPNELGKESALAAQDLGASLDCFSEIDTESSTPESNKIAYLEQLLRLREPQHLSETQQSGRRFVLDMLRFLCQLPDMQQAQAGPQAWDPNLEFKYLVYLLERTAKPDLAEQMRHADSILSLDEPTILALREWLSRHGLDAHELALIQPNFFRGKKAAMQVEHQMSLHPMFAALSRASSERNHDYLASTFFGMSQPPVLQHADHHPRLKAQFKPQAGLEEAMATIFEPPYDESAATQTRLKAFFIPNRHGEPMIALSFTND